MTWFAQSPNETEAAKEHVLMFVAAAFDFASGISRYWSGIGDLTFGGFTYTGTGELGSISTPSESIRLIGETKTFRLSGVDPAIVPETDIDASFGRDVTEYFGFLNPDTHALIAAPEINWEGRMDAMRRVDGEEPVIDVNCEHRSVWLQRTDGWRYNNEHQQQFFPGDLGFDQLPAQESKDFFWGGTRAIIGIRHGARPIPIYGGD